MRRYEFANLEFEHYPEGPNSPSRTEVRFTNHTAQQQIKLDYTHTDKILADLSIQGWCIVRLRGVNEWGPYAHFQREITDQPEMLETYLDQHQGDMEAALKEYYEYIAWRNKQMKGESDAK